MDIQLKKAISISGGPASLARSLEINSQAVSQWLKAPVDRVIAISAAINWLITPHLLRPDIYPHPSDGLPKEIRKDNKSSASV